LSPVSTLYSLEFLSSQELALTQQKVLFFSNKEEKLLGAERFNAHRTEVGSMDGLNC
jgi:hypothetical protein